MNGQAVNLPERVLIRGQPKFNLHLVKVRGKNPIDEMLHCILSGPVSLHVWHFKEEPSILSLSITSTLFGWQWWGCTAFVDSLEGKENTIICKGDHHSDGTFLLCSDCCDLLGADLCIYHVAALCKSGLGLITVHHQFWRNVFVFDWKCHVDKGLCENLIRIDRYLPTCSCGTSHNPAKGMINKFLDKCLWTLEEQVKVLKICGAECWSWAIMMPWIVSRVRGIFLSQSCCNDFRICSIASG